MADSKDRRAALRNLSAKVTRDRKDPFHDVDIKPYDRVDETTGELHARVLADYDPETHKIARNIRRKNIPKKQADPFVRIRRGATADLVRNEKHIYYELTELISWENNFAKNADGSYMSISQFTDSINMSRPHVTKMLQQLESKHLLRIVNTGKGKAAYIYLYCSFVWFGYEKNRSDAALGEVMKE